MINAVRDFQHPALEKNIGNVHFVDYIMVALGLSQFDIQEFLPYKYYRYTYIFNFKNDVLDMKSVFKSQFGTSYEEFRKLGTILNILEGSNDLMLIQEILEYILFKECPNAYKQLTISAQEYVEQIDNFATHQRDYMYCLRPSYKYPFIVSKNIAYYPLPHLLGRSVTSSLLYRITDQNDYLRALIGKEVIEKYLFDLLIDAKIYDEVIPEQVYQLKYNKRTLDVMVRKGNKFLLLDSKSSVPRAKLRILDEELAFNKEIDIASDNLLQVYYHINKYFPALYNFFDYNDEIDMENIYGVVVVLEDNFIRRSLIYERAAYKLKIEVNSYEYNWIVNHVKMVNLFDIEKISFIGKSLIYEFENQKLENKDYDFPLSSTKEEGGHIVNNSYLDFKKEWLSEISNVSDNMVKNKIIQ